MKRLNNLERNILLNGGILVAERTLEDVTLSQVPAYLNIDRFMMYAHGFESSVVKAGISSNVPSNGKSNRSMRFFFQRESESAGSFFMQQRIESLKAAELSEDTVSFSCMLSSQVVNKVVVSLVVPSETDSYNDSETVIYTKTVNVVPSEAFVLVKAEAMPVMNSSKGLCVRVEFVCPVGADLSLSESFVAQLKLNMGHQALGFTHYGVDIQEEIFKCSRYFVSLNKITPRISGVPFKTSIDLATPMRVLPIVSSLTVNDSGTVSMSQLSTGLSVGKLMFSGSENATGNGWHQLIGQLDAEI